MNSKMRTYGINFFNMARQRMPEFSEKNDMLVNIFRYVIIDKRVD